MQRSSDSSRSVRVQPAHRPQLQRVQCVKQRGARAGAAAAAQRRAARQRPHCAQVN